MVISKRNFLLSSIIIFLIFVLFSYLVHKNFFTQFDFNITVKLQDHLPRRVDQPFSLLSTIGSVEVAGIFLLLILLVRRKLSGFIVLFLFGFFHVFELYGKTFVKHFPPPHFFLRTHELFNMPQFYVSAENSYPSGHTARAVFITTILYFFVRKNKHIKKTQKLLFLGILAIYDICMAISRVYLGEHWTSDVIGGAILGFAFGVLSGIFI